MPHELDTYIIKSLQVEPNICSADKRYLPLWWISSKNNKNFASAFAIMNCFIKQWGFWSSRRIIWYTAKGCKIRIPHTSMTNYGPENIWMRKTNLDQKSRFSSKLVAPKCNKYWENGKKRNGRWGEMSCTTAFHDLHVICCLNSVSHS